MHTAHNFNVWRSIDRLSKDYNIDIPMILEGTLVKRGCELDAYELIRIAKNLGIDSKSLLTANFDLNAVASRLKGDKLFVPDKYKAGMFSSSTSLKNIVSQFSRFGMREYVLNKIQIDEDYLKEHRPLSVHAVYDALGSVTGFVTEEDIKSYSRSNAEDFMQKKFGQEVLKQMTSSKIVDTIIEMVHHVERNWDYRILEVKGGDYLIESTQAPEMFEICGGELYTSAIMNKMRLYFFYYFMQLCGLEGHSVELLSQEFDDNSKLIFKISTSKAKIRLPS